MSAMVSVRCDGCGAKFMKLASAMRRARRKRNFCRPACFKLNADYRSLGRPKNKPAVRAG